MFYDVRELKIETLTVNIENDTLEKPRIVSFSTKGFRVLKNGFWGIFEGDVSDAEGLKEAERNIIASCDVEIVESVFRGKHEVKLKIDPRDLPIDEKLSFLKDLSKNLEAKSKKISYFETFRFFHYYDSNGSDVSYFVPRIGLNIFGIDKGETLQFFGKRLMKVGGWEKLKDAHKLVEEINEILPKLLKAKVPPSGDMNVVMNPELAGVFIHEAFGHAAEADHVLQGSSVLAGKIGEKIACEKVNIVDDPTLQEFGFYPFDDEGVETKKKFLVKNGVLKSYLHNRETAKKLNGEAGNGRAESVEIPIPRMSNTYIETGEYSLDELLEICKDGVIMFGSRGGETDPATGYFQFSAQYGYIVKRGEICEMIRDVALSGNTLEILKNLKLGKEIEFDPGFCGKAFQQVPVADGAPYILCKAIVGGA